jgi:hypothetical protein
MLDLKLVTVSYSSNKQLQCCLIIIQLTAPPNDIVTVLFPNKYLLDVLDSIINRVY